MKKVFTLVTLTLCSFALVVAQTNPLNLEDIYKKNVYGAKGFGPIRFMKDNKGYTTLEYNRELKSNEIVLYNIKNMKPLWCYKIYVYFYYIFQ